MAQVIILSFYQHNALIKFQVYNPYSIHNYCVNNEKVQVIIFIFHVYNIPIKFHVYNSY